VACSVCHNSMSRGASIISEIDEKNGLGVVQKECEGKNGTVDIAQIMHEISMIAPHSNRGILGFSTGCLHQSEIRLVDKLKAFLRAGATILELVFRTPEDLFNFSFSEVEMSKFRKFTMITIHAPCDNIRYFDGLGMTDAVLKRIKDISDQLAVSGVIFHPDTVDNFHGLELVGLPVLFENLDKNNSVFILPEEFEKLRMDYDFGFVLDLQHVFEHDQSMFMADEMVLAMGNRLNHLHVSGCNGQYCHAPLYSSNNWRDISRTLKTILTVPVVMEGLLTGNISEATKREYAFVSENGVSP
jgi:hypothetical protein